MGKWATYQKRGGSNQYGTLAAPGVSGVDWSATTGGVGVINVTRLAGLATGATGMNYRAIDTTTQLVTVNWNGSLTGLVSGRAYKVQAAWFNGATQLSEASPAVTVNAG